MGTAGHLIHGLFGPNPTDLCPSRIVTTNRDRLTKNTARTPQRTDNKLKRNELLNGRSCATFFSFSFLFSIPRLVFEGGRFYCRNIRNIGNGRFNNWNVSKNCDRKWWWREIRFVEREREREIVIENEVEIKIIKRIIFWSLEIIKICQNLILSSREYFFIFKVIKFRKVWSFFFYYMKIIER